MTKCGSPATAKSNHRVRQFDGGDNAFAPGTYRGGLHFNGLQGQEGKPIILAAADKIKQPIFQGNNSCFHLTDPAYVELHNLVLTEASGNGINIDDGGSYDSPAHHVVLHGLTIRDIGPDGNRDAIKLSGMDNFRVESCTMERWGNSGSAIDVGQLGTPHLNEKPTGDTACCCGN